MIFFKTKFFLFLLLVVGVAAFYYFGNPTKFAQNIIPRLKATPLAPIAEKFENFDTKELTDSVKAGVQNAENEISTLGEKTAEVTKHTGNVLGSSITVTPEDKQTPIHEKALEYGQYIYCRQIVEDYESANPSLKK